MYELHCVRLTSTQSPHLGAHVRAFRPSNALLRHLRDANVLQRRRSWRAKHADAYYSAILRWCFWVFAIGQQRWCYCRHVFCIAAWSRYYAVRCSAFPWVSLISLMGMGARLTRVNSPVIGPIVGGFAGEAIGWRWVEGIMAIFTGVLW